MTYEEASALAKAILENAPKAARKNAKTGFELMRFDFYATAIECIEKQIPKKPTYTGEKNVYGAVVRICNECGDKVCISPMAKEYENYCRSCGKRLTDWSEVQDEID